MNAQSTTFIGRPKGQRIQLTCAVCLDTFLVIPSRVEISKTCSRKCAGVRHAARITRPLLDRFWEKVDRLGPDECWPWTGSVDQHGYGHRIIAILFGVSESLVKAIVDRKVWRHVA